MSLLKISIEDVAFKLWNGQDDVTVFTTKFLNDYPGFEEFWDIDSLAKILEERL